MKTDFNRNWIVCLGGEDWWYHSHGHFDIQIMKCFSERVPVLYVCSIGMRMPSIRRDKQFWGRVKRKLGSVSHVLHKVSQQLYVYSPIPFPFYQYRLGRAINSIVLRCQLFLVYQFLGIKSPLVWVNTPTAWPVIEKRPKSGLVYQRTDDYAAYDFDNFNADYVQLVDNNLLRHSDLVIHVSEELHKEAVKIAKCSLLLSQGVDERFFDFKGPPPEDIKMIPKPIIGYVGGMDSHKFDTSLVFQVAKNLPDCSFVLVGMPHANVDDLRSLPNVHFLGVKRHDQIPAYVHSFDICILPTARTQWGLKCRPIKLMEYLAASKPVIATPTPASSGYGQVVCIADDVPSWVHAIKLLTCGETGSVTSTQLPAQCLKSWNNLAEQLWSRLETAKLISFG
ncbi:MAG: glycosyltransferase [Desulfobulbaceae bacterium]